MKALLPQLNVTLEHTTQRNKDEGEADITFAVNGKFSHKLSFLYDDQLVRFTRPDNGRQQAPRRRRRRQPS